MMNTDDNAWGVPFSRNEAAAPARSLRRHGDGAVSAQAVEPDAQARADEAAGEVPQACLRQQVRQLQARLIEMAAEHAAEKQRMVFDLESLCRSVTHDLRNQAAAVRGFAQLLLETQGCDSDNDVRDNIAWVVRSSDQLSVMLNAVLDLARIEFRSLLIERVDLGELAGAIARALKRNYAGRVVNVTIADMAPVAGDAELLRLALHSLMDNAWKFTANVACAQIEVGSARNEQGVVAYHVRDNGMGFPARQSARAFLPLKRLPNAQEFPGAGAGLSAVQRIVEKHGGTVWADSVPGGGTTVYFTLGGDAAQA